MTEDVLIILNDQETPKRQKALELKNLLLSLGYCSDIVSPSRDVAATVSERAPQIVVLDYLLGESATALDVLALLRLSRDEERTVVIIWTDEPSVGVAVSAMRLGAYDYVQMESPRSIEKVCQAIRTLMEPDSRSESPKSTEFHFNSIEPSIGQSRQYRECLKHALSSVARREPISVLLGEPGSGRSHLARNMHSQRQSAGVLVEIDLDLWDSPVETVCGSRSSYESLPLLSHSSTLVIDHAEFDPGELVEHVADAQHRIWADVDDYLRPMLIIGTSSAVTARVWNRLTGAEIIAVPPVRERSEDILPLCLSLLRLPALAELAARRTIKVEPVLINALSHLTWPGNFRELRNCFIDAVVCCAQQSAKQNLQADLVTIPDSMPAEDAASLSVEQRQLLLEIIGAKMRWERYERTPPFFPDPVIARAAYECAEHNWRIAAARLGTGVAQLKAVLSPNRDKMSLSALGGKP